MLDIDDPPNVPNKPRRLIAFVHRIFPRLVVRRVNEKSLAEDVQREALESGEWAFRCVHGGATTKNYRHKADTEAALAVANPAGLVVVWMARLPASRVTISGAANACLPGSRPLFDSRYSEPSKEAAWDLVLSAHRKFFPPTAHERLLAADSF